jgi:hypothetical protein
MHSILELRAHLLGYNVGIDVLETIGELADTSQDLVERNVLDTTIALHDSKVIHLGIQ